MITHNGKQVTLAMRNRKAINLIARNGKAMFGEFVNWQDAYIDAAARAVILAEYGSVVWSDVKQYAKAHPQIVEFINTDPHLACSISPNSNKERWLVAGMENSDIETNIPLYGYDQIEWKWMQTSYSGSLMQFGSRTGGSGTAGIIVSLGKTIKNIIRIYNKAWSTILSNTQDYKPYTTVLDFVRNKIIIDSVEYSHTFTEENKNAATFKIMDAVDGYISTVKAGDRMLIPCLSNGAAGWLDTDTATFFPASKGQFTIAVTDKA